MKNKDHTSPRFAALGALKITTSLLFVGLIAVAYATEARADDNLKNKGIGPVTEIKLETLNAVLAGKGKGVFETKCSACHKLETRYVGPGLAGVTTRRSPEWIMNMILNPAEMLQQDAIAQELLGEYLTQMPFQNVSKDDARAILEYFRQADSKVNAKK